MRAYIPFLAVAASCICFSVMSLGVKLASKSISPVVTSLARYASQALAGTVAVLVTQPPYGLRSVPGYRLLTALRAGLGCFSLLILFLSVSLLPLGDATAIIFLSPALAAFAGSFLFGDRLRALDICCLLGGLLGVLIIARPPFLLSLFSSGTPPHGLPHEATATATDLTPSFWGSGAAPVASKTGGMYAVLVSLPRWSATVLATCGALVAAGAYLSVRAVGTNVATSVLVAWFGYFGMVIIPLLMIVTSEPLPDNAPWQAWAYVGLSSITGTAGQFLFNFGLQQGRSTAIITRYLDVVFSYLLQVVVMREPLDAVSVVGSVIICGTALVLTFQSDAKKSATADSTNETVAIPMEDVESHVLSEEDSLDASKLQTRHDHYENIFATSEEEDDSSK